MTTVDATEDLPTVGVMTVATNRYLDYWAEMASSADRHLFPGHQLFMHVFTDRPNDARALGGALTRTVVDAIPIEALRWPDATLLRYEIFDTYRDRLAEEILVHLDADMLVVRDSGIELHPTSWSEGIALVRHPGFRRPSMSRRLPLYARNPRLMLSDARAQSRLGGIGSWETNGASRAFVPKDHRETYVCGGTWMGRNEALLPMIAELAQRTRSDLNEGTIAKWHDESHLNWYASTHAVTFLESEYCYAMGFPNLSDLTPRILAVDKGDDRTR